MAGEESTKELSMCRPLCKSADVEFVNMLAFLFMRHVFWLGVEFLDCWE